MFRPTVAHISLDNFRHNVRTLRKLSFGDNFFCPMVKANAYGHGDIQLARVLEDEGVQALGVALIEEGTRLREANIEGAEILVFYPHLNFRAIDELLKYKLTPVVSTWESLCLLEERASAQNKKVQIHLKFNTGMNRLGFAAEQTLSVAELCRKSTHLQVLGVCTHLQSADDAGFNDRATAQQLNQLQKLVAQFSGLPLQVHALNSEATLARNCFSLGQYNDMGSRPGISLYGIKPQLQNLAGSSQERWNAIELKPVLSLRSHIVQTQKVRKGEGVSYGATYRAPFDTTVAVIPMGYADGFSRKFSNNGIVLIAGEELPISGTVCMDYFMVDMAKSSLSDKACHEHEVVILGHQNGKQISAEQLAKNAATNTYEILTNISARVPRVYV